MKLQKRYNGYSSTDNFLSPILISDWLISCCENLILRQKINENNKNTNSVIKTIKNANKAYGIIK